MDVLLPLLLVKGTCPCVMGVASVNEPNDVSPWSCWETPVYPPLPLPLLVTGKRGSASRGGDEDKRSRSGGRGVLDREDGWEEGGGGGKRGGMDEFILVVPSVGGFSLCVLMSGLLVYHQDVVRQCGGVWWQVVVVVVVVVQILLSIYLLWMTKPRSSG